MSERTGGTAASFTEGLAPKPSAAEVNPAAFTQTPPSITNVFRWRAQVAGTTSSSHLYVVANQRDPLVETSLSLPGEVDYATLPPLAGFYDRPHVDIRSRCIVSERTGGTAQPWFK